MWDVGLYLINSDHIHPKFSISFGPNGLMEANNVDVELGKSTIGPLNIVSDQPTKVANFTF